MFLDGESLTAVFSPCRGTEIDRVFYKGDSHPWRERMDFAELVLHEALNMGTSYADGGVVYRGQYAQDLYEGSGTLYQNRSMIYEGGFSGGKYNGSGTVYKNGKILYQGQLKDGVYEGAGELYEDGELCYKGTFVAGVFDGTGTAYQNGKLAYEGMPCVPVTPAPWMPGCPTVTVCKRLLLNNTSKLMCAYGGVISVTMTPAVTVKTP